ncbi:MAG: flavodoxin [Acholeplasmataceae bacterium]|nr:flavodoxin [Acholeplasmataceae bacterium]
MKKVLALVTTLIMAFTLIGCGGNGGSKTKTESKADVAAPNVSNQVKPDSVKTGKILIAYFSKTGNTKSVAQEIQKNVGGDLFEIKTTNTYPEEYQAATEQAKTEKNNKFRPQLATQVADFASYDVIFVGYPIWWGTMPMGVFSFLEQNNFAGKTVIPFCTHGGSGLGDSVSEIKKTLPQANVLSGLAVRGSEAGKAQTEIANWLKNIGMAK